MTDNSSLSPRSFYKSLGFGNQSFAYTQITSACVVAVTIPALLLYDRIGRRPIMIVGSFLMIPGLLIVAILGSKTKHASGDVGAIVFSVILYSTAVKVAFSTPCYMMAGEIGGVKMRKKSELSVSAPRHSKHHCIASAPHS